jgi:predicted  nucleic acid-binding Zn-ribbon protein
MNARNDSFDAEDAESLSEIVTTDLLRQRQTVCALQTETAGLWSQIALNEAQIARVRSQMAASDNEIAALEHETSHLRDRAARTKARISALEAALGLQRQNLHRNANGRLRP